MQCVLTDEQLLQLLRDDVPYGDLTSDLLLDGSSGSGSSIPPEKP